MKKLAFIFSLLAVCGFMAGACGDDNGNGEPHCVADVVCDPACATDGTEMCDVTSGNCIVFKTCDPVCATDGSEACDPISGTCKATCLDPACTATEWCDDGTCKALTVCEPACGADEHCVP